MKANVVGRVKNTHLPKSQGLLPLYEAIVNSIDSIEDSGRDLSKASITVKIFRVPELPKIEEQESIEEGKRYFSPIQGFEIVDNGIGFTDENFSSFNESDTQYKAIKGGKGVGRFMWLKAFEKVEVNSVFRNNGSRFRRTFDFSLATPEGVYNHDVTSDPKPKDEITVVRLLNFREEYEKHVPHNPHKIGQRIVEHCLEYYYLANMPEVLLIDNEESTPISLDEIYDSLVANKKVVSAKIQGHKFDVTHFLLHAHADLRHHVSYCANRRVVTTEKLEAKIPNLPPTLSNENDEDELIYAGYVSSAYLDKHVNQQRTGFEAMPDGGFVIPGELSWKDIQAEVLNLSRNALKSYTEAIRTQKEERIKEYINASAPEYRHIIKNHADKLDDISPELSDDNLNIKLYEIHKEIEVSLKKEVDEIIKVDDEKTYEEHWQKLSQYWDEWNEVGKANLARYIVHRKLMLTILEKALKYQGGGKYSLEEAVHQIIFPLKSTSDDIAYDQHNLWIIDEKLSYHHYLSSDVPLNKVNVLKSNSDSRPDLLFLFDRPIAVVEDEAPYTSVVIFEFKRPMRDDYKADENPIEQTFRYVEQIKSDKMVDKNGRPVNLSPTTPFYCYIVCDLTPRLKEQARHYGLRLTPDADGYFGYNENVGTYIEIISFNKLVRDAKKRNRILFEKLNLPGAI